MVGMKCFRRALTSLSVAFALLHVAALGVAGLPISQHDRHGGLGRENPAPLSSILEQHPERITFDVERVARHEGILQAIPRELERSGDFVSLTWSKLPPTAQGYTIGVYLAGEDVTKVAPIKYLPIDRGQEAGDSASFQLVNMRNAVVFILFEGDIDHPAVVARSNEVSWKNPTEPTGGHLALGKDSGSMIISWANARAAEDQSVQLGFMRGQYNRTVAAGRAAYSQADLCGPPATTVGWRDTGAHFHAALADLPPGAQVYYRYGSEAGGWSAEEAFTVMDPSAERVTMVAFGDMGVHHSDASVQHWDSPQSRNTTDALRARLDAGAGDAGSLVLHFGDVSYAVGYASQWEHFMNQIEPVARRVPWMVAEGNHERCWPGTGSRGETDSGGECSVPFRARFPMPWKDPRAPWYSFELGKMHVAVLATELDAPAQNAWLAADLAAVDRARTPWVVVATHRPLYISSTSTGGVWDDQDVAAVLRAQLEALLLRYGVDLVLSGHHHSYQRTCPIAHGRCVPRGAGGVVYVVAGMAGFGTTFNVQEPQPEVFEVVDVEHHGFTTVSVSADSLVLRYYGGSDAALLDTLELSKNPGGGGR